MSCPSFPHSSWSLRMNDLRRQTNLNLPRQDRFQPPRPPTRVKVLRQEQTPLRGTWPRKQQLALRGELSQRAWASQLQAY